MTTPPEEERVIRVLVAEDSAVTREYLVHLLNTDPALEVVGIARDGVEAVEQAQRLKPDVIAMDIHMPRLDGYEATRQIMERVPTPIVMVTASLERDEVAMSFEALRNGALTVVAKPAGPDHPDRDESVRQFVDTVKMMAEVKVVRRWPRRPPARLAPPPARAAGRIDVVAIGASTGGPQTIAEILTGLPRDLPVPILAVQHIAPGFIGGLAEWLNGQTALGVKVAEPAEAMRPGSMYLAPDGFDIGVTADGRIRLVRDPASDGFRPSASYLFHSVAAVYGRSAVGVLLTGMGRDGADGLRRLRDAGGVTIAQDAESSVVFGMPGEAIRLGAAGYVLAPAQIGAMIRWLAVRA